MASRRANSVVCILLCLVFVASDSVLAKPHHSALATVDDVIPPVLKVPEGNEVQQVLLGAGVQIYLYNGTAWTLHNVSADLYNFKGVKIGYHFFLAEKDVNGGQSSWEIFHPYSRVTGASVESVEVESDSINWLLIQATSSRGKTFLGVTTYIQRLYTQHGKAPSADYAAVEGDIFKSNYTALYKYSTKCAL